MSVYTAISGFYELAWSDKKYRWAYEDPTL
jgi:hypothetical protein